MVSNWCQNRKNHNFKGNKILQTIDFKGSAKNIKIISTQKSKVPEEIQRFYWQFDMVLIM